MHMRSTAESIGLSSWTITLGGVPVIFESCLSSRQGTKAKQKGRIYEGLLKVHGDKENADIIKN
jgi:hypothetical protein